MRKTILVFYIYFRHRSQFLKASQFIKIGIHHQIDVEKKYCQKKFNYSRNITEI